MLLNTLRLKWPERGRSKMIQMVRDGILRVEDEAEERAVETMRAFAAVREAEAQRAPGDGGLAAALESLVTSYAHDPRDWSLYDRDAWTYGIVCGWSDEPGAMEEVAALHGWDAETVARLERLHRAYDAALSAPPSAGVSVGSLQPHELDGPRLRCKRCLMTWPCPAAALGPSAQEGASE